MCLDNYFLGKSFFGQQFQHQIYLLGTIFRRKDHTEYVISNGKVVCDKQGQINSFHFISLSQVPTIEQITLYELHNKLYHMMDCELVKSCIISCSMNCTMSCIMYCTMICTGSCIVRSTVSFAMCCTKGCTIGCTISYIMICTMT